MVENFTKEKQKKAIQEILTNQVALRSKKELIEKFIEKHLPKLEEDEDIDVVFIDCVHDYHHIKSDIDNSINSFNKPILVFDDYGLFPELKKAIDEYIERGQLKLLKYIGDYSGTIYPKTQHKILKDREGLICQVT